MKNPQNMTREEAREAIGHGSRITHRYFLPNESIQLDPNRQLVDADGNILNENTFWTLRSSKNFDEGWSIVCNH